MRVVSLDEQREFASQFPLVEGNDQLVRAFVLDGAYEPLDNGKAAVLADRAEPPPDFTTATPAPEPLVGELTAVVSNEHAWGRPSLSHGPPEDGPDGLGCRLLPKHCETHDPPREVIDGNSHPPAEWPSLYHRPGHPRAPESHGGWDGREIDVPDVVCFLERMRRAAGAGSLMTSQSAVPRSIRPTVVVLR